MLTQSHKITLSFLSWSPIDQWQFSDITFGPLVQKLIIVVCSSCFIMFNSLSSKITNYFLTVTLITENWCFHLYLKLQYAVEMHEICHIPKKMLPSYWQNKITQLIGCYVVVWYQLGPRLFSCWQCRSWSTSVRPFSMFYYLSQENGHSVDVLGNSKAQMLGFHVYLFSNRSHMEISA